MATVSTFGAWKVVIYPSGSDQNPSGGRREHGPPHFSYEKINREFATRIKIPCTPPKDITEFEIWDKRIQRSELKLLLEWMVGYTKVHGEFGVIRVSNYQRLIDQWNLENPTLSIVEIEDDVGNITKREFKGNSNW